MGCHAPLPAWFASERNENGKRPITFTGDMADFHRPIDIRCGKCVGCKLDRAREWALRCSHEAELWPFNWFITLTYDDEHIHRNKYNRNYTLYKPDFVNFMKRLRKKRPRKTIRFFQCGEYGESTLRPHHHALLFNLDLHDLERCRKSGDYTLYRSKEIQQLWGKGETQIGEVNYTTAAYVARYTCKQSQTPPGSIIEYLTMSRRPGIGKLWLEKYMADVYPSDLCVTPSGTKNRPPRYYDNSLAQRHPAMLSHIQAERFRQLYNFNITEDAPRRRDAKSKIQINKLKPRSQM